MAAMDTQMVVRNSTPGYSEGGSSHGTTAKDAVVMVVVAKETSWDAASSDLTDASKEELHRHGDKYSVMYHNVTAMLGAGVLGLPATFIFLGWYAGTICLVVSLFISWYTFYLLVQLHEVKPEGKGEPVRRFDTYQELCKYAFGPVRGWWAVMPFQIAVLYGMGVTYTVTGALNLRTFYQLNGGEDMNKISYWVLIFSGVELLLSFVPDFSALGWISLMGMLMSAVYSIMAVVLSGVYPEAPDVSYKAGGDSHMENFFGIFNALSTIAFAYGGHNIALEIQATLPAGPTESTKAPMMFGVHSAFIMTAMAYFSVAITGFWAFGNTVAENILDSLTQPVGAISAAHLAVVFHVLSSYQVYSFPLFDTIEASVVKSAHNYGHDLEQGSTKRFLVRMIIRSIYVGTTCFLACLIPFFGDLMGLIGALAITPTTFVLPSILWLTLRRPSRRTFEFWINVLIIIVMSSIGIMGTISSTRAIVNNASTYRPFS